MIDLEMEMAGESADWFSTLDRAPLAMADMLLVDWDVLPTLPYKAIGELRSLCPAALVIILLSHLDDRQQAALSAGVNAFISKTEMPNRVAERLRVLAANINTM